MLKSEQVFKPGAFPDYTYVSREFDSPNISYELRLKQAMKISGCLTSLIGPSKMGKTILCEKVIGFDKIVEVSGADFTDDIDFWDVVAAKAGLPYDLEVTKSTTIKDSIEDENYKKTDKYRLVKDKVIEYYRANELVLVLDDFHYAIPEKREKIAQQLKDAIRREFKAIVVSLPHRSDDAIRQNSDLSGRLSLINIEPWCENELKQIAIKGFNELNISISDKIAHKIAVESLTSPQLMQYICLSICTLHGVDEKKVEKIDESKLEKAYRFTTMNFDYRDVVNILSKGPNTRGKKRNIYKTTDGQEVDIYGLIVESLAKNPPITELHFNDLKDRIDTLIVGEEKPNKKALRDSLKKLQELLNTKENIYKALEWKDDKVYIVDPLFLFYLRWGRN